MAKNGSRRAEEKEREDLEMNGINSTTLIGNLTKKPAIRYTQGGTAVLGMRLAVDERVKRGGEWVKETTYFNATIFGTRAEGLAKVLDKGQTVYVQGPVRCRQYVTKDSQEHRADMEVSCRELRIIRWPQGKQNQAGAAEADPPMDDELLAAEAAALAEVTEAPVAE